MFQIDFYGYDEDPTFFADLSFEAQPPTSGGVLLTDSIFIGGDPAGGGGDHDGSGTYNLGPALAGIEPHPEQGHHVKLTIEADGSQGSPVKHKTFWVEGCGGTTTTTTSTTTTTVPDTTTTTAPPETTTTTAPPETTTTTAPPETTTTTAPPETTTTTAPPETTTTTAPPESTTTTAPPESTTSSEPPTTEPPTTEPPTTEPPTTTTEKEKEEGLLARTGSEIGPIVGVGLGLLAAGALVAFLARRRTV